MNKRRIGSLLITLCSFTLHGEIITETSQVKLSDFSPFDLNSDGEPEFLFAHTGGRIAGRPAAWEVWMNGHVEFLFENPYWLQVLPDGSVIESIPTTGYWAPGPFSGFISQSIWDTSLSVTLTDPFDLNDPSIQPQTWGPPFFGLEEVFIGFRFLEDTDYYYGYLHIDLYHDQYLRLPDGDPILVVEHSAYAEVLSLVYESDPNTPVSAVPIPESPLISFIMATFGVAFALGIKSRSNRW